MTDPFETAAAPVRKTGTGVDSRDPAEVRRDGHGRYMIPGLPADYLAQFATKGYATPTGRDEAWTRATTFAKSISDTFTLSQWSQRMVVKGLSMRPDLIALAAATRVDDKRTLDDIANQAKDAAAVRARANLGTAVHGFTEMHDRGEDLSGVPVQFMPDVAAWATALANHGLMPEPGLIEQTVVNTRWGVAGTFDRVFSVRNRTEHVVGDLKTGRDLQYGWNEIAIQLVIYATADAIYDWVTNWFYPMPKRLDQSRALVIHLPAGTGEADTYTVKLAEAAEAADLCLGVRKWRATRNLATLLSVVEYQVEQDDPAPERSEQAKFMDRVFQAADEHVADLAGSGPALELTGQTCPACGEPRAVVDANVGDWSCKACDSWGTEYGQEVAKRLWEAQDVVDDAQDARKLLDAQGGPLAPFAGPGERGCSVCRRKGHRANSPKCLGQRDPGMTMATVAEPDATDVWLVEQGDRRPGDGEQLAQCQRTPECIAAGIVPAKDAQGTATGRLVCRKCGLLLHQDDVPAAVQEATKTPATAGRIGVHPPVEDPAPAAATELEDGGDPFADEPMPAPKPVKVRPPTDLERILAAGSTGEVQAIGRELKAKGKMTDELKAAGRARMAKLAEPAG